MFDIFLINIYFNQFTIRQRLSFIKIEKEKMQSFRGGENDYDLNQRLTTKKQSREEVQKEIYDLDSRENLSVKNSYNNVAEKIESYLQQEVSTVYIVTAIFIFH